jgi:hypothetical protein
VLHLIELQKFLDELEGVLASGTLGQFLNLQIFSVEGGGLDIVGGTFLEEAS